MNELILCFRMLMINGDIILGVLFFIVEIFFLFLFFKFILDDEYFLMGNQIAHIPNQILNVETYFNDLSGYDYVKK
jgi:hypothetical protein